MAASDRERRAPPPPPRDAGESLQRITVALERIATASEQIAAALRRQPIDGSSLLSGLGELLRERRRGG